MGLRVNTNIASLTAQRNLSTVTARLQGNYSRLSSGLRIATAADDAAGLAISEKMRSQIRSYGVAGRNAQDGISLVQTAEGALNEVSNILSRMRELSVQAANGTMSLTDRQTTDVEFQSLLSEIDRIADSTEFNEISLLDGSTATLDIQVGIGTAASDQVTISLVDVNTDAAGLNLAGNDVTDVANSQASITAIDLA
ncbi:MAG: flagellin FliC, partial [Planctomycetota bacterium]|nr:flagellin FliC [Planctomycetota bacterium]